MSRARIAPVAARCRTTSTGTSPRTDAPIANALASIPATSSTVNGPAELVSAIVRNHPNLAANMIGSTEETTTGRRKRRTKAEIEAAKKA